MCGSRVLGVDSYLHNYEPLEPSRISCKRTLPRLLLCPCHRLGAITKCDALTVNAQQKDFDFLPPAAKQQQAKGAAAGSPDEIKSKHSYKRRNAVQHECPFSPKDLIIIIESIGASVGAVLFSFSFPLPLLGLLPRGK